MKKVPTELKGIVTRCVAEAKGYMWGRDVAVTFVGRDDARRSALEATLTAPASSDVYGLLVIDVRFKHPDSLSVGGGFALRANDTHAVRTKVMRVLADASGQADLDKLVRDDGPVAKAVA